MRYFPIILCIMISFVLMHPDRGNAEVLAFIPNSFNDSISVIRVADHTVIRTFNTGDEPQALAATPDGNYVCVANNGDHTVSVIRASDNTIVNTVPVGTSPYAYGKFIYDVSVIPDAVIPDPGRIDRILLPCAGV